MEVVFKIFKISKITLSSTKSRTTNVKKQVLLISSYFTSIPDGWRVGRRAGGQAAGGNENKANSASQLKLELGLG